MDEIFVFFLGTVAGSFTCMSIYRIPLGLSLLLPRSHCALCKAPLKAADLVPVLSWLWLRGKCCYCRQKIGWRELAVENISGILYVAAYRQIPEAAALLSAFALIYFLLVIAYIDYDCLFIFNKVLYRMFIVGFLFHLFFSVTTDVFSLRLWIDCWGGFFVGGVLMFLLFAVSGGMGLGDVWFTAVTGFWLGTEKVLLMIFFAFTLGGIIGIALLLLGKKKRKDYISFGPFLATAAFFSYLYGNEFMRYYQEFFR